MSKACFICVQWGRDISVRVYGEAALPSKQTKVSEIQGCLGGE